MQQKCIQNEETEGIARLYVQNFPKAPTSYTPVKLFLNELNIYLGHPKEKSSSEMKLNSFTIYSHMNV